MKLQRATALAALLTATLCVGTGTAYAVPARSADPTVHSRTSLSSDGRSVDTAIDSGTFSLSHTAAAVEVSNDAGTTVASIPLRYSVAGTAFTIDPNITEDGRFLRLTPSTTPISGTLDVTKVDRDSAYTNLINQIEIGWVNGGAVSTAVGAGIGAVAGCILFLFVGCIPGAGIGAAIGAVTGINNANPAVTPAIFEFLKTP